ncbi:hypothetical protein C8J57DRAFT_1435715 [Mycena rebaudengoi]|nr:hypothetical protein C8J57DRAFT_1435715 [Mycena rebaudengoi]
MRECGTPNVPSFSALRKKQAQLTEAVHIKTTRHASAMGNDFFMNHPAELLALDWANLLVREFIQVYPEITENISEFIQADKWVKEVDLDDLSPMWADWKAAVHKHFYVKELAQLKNGEFVVPIRWVIFNKEEHAEVHKVVHYPESNCFIIRTEEILRVPATDLKYNYLGLRASGYVLKFPEIAKGCPSDDVSGNVSKQFNAHMNLYMASANLPHRKVSQEFFVCFCSTSPHASSGEQFDALSEDLDPTKYHEAYDCQLEQDILFRIFAHVLPADNPQQAESASNAGVHSNHWCRYDMAGGTAAERETDEGYLALFKIKPGIARTPAETVRTIKRQIWAACSGVQEAVDSLQTSTGMKDKMALFWIDKLIVKARETQKERIDADPRLKDKTLNGEARKKVKRRIKDLVQWQLYNWVILQPEDRYEKLPEKSGDHYNILLSIRGLDPHRDSPCEILPSVLLGDDKYIWHETNKPWDKAKGEKFAVQLQSSSVEGLNLASVRGRYIVQYKNALIGKHFKILQQLGAFHLHEDLCSKNLFDLWKASGELGALLWYPEIRNLEQYLADLQICIDNVLDIWALIDPSRIITKFKLHVLPHLIDDIQRFGPAILFATEGFECWNTIFRLCSILSNHQSPSHDIGVALADMERFKHIVSGGWWKPTGSPEYIKAGRKIAGFLEQHRELQRRLGWMDKSKPKPGTWKHMLDQDWGPEFDAYGAGKNWTAGDICKPNSWIFFKAPLSGEIFTGRIRVILTPVDSSTQETQAVAVIQRFNVSATRDIHLNMPDILFFFNAQHDCQGCNCKAVEQSESVVQEQGITRRKQTADQHTPTDRYFINMHRLHNAHLLRDTLPRNLTAPVPYFPDREAKHKEFAGQLRILGPAKRAATAKKSMETREKNRRDKSRGGDGLAPEQEDDIGGDDA